MSENTGREGEQQVNGKEGHPKHEPQLVKGLNIENTNELVVLSSVLKLINIL